MLLIINKIIAQSAAATPTATLQTGMTSNECLGYDTKQADDKVPVMLVLWEMQCSSSLSSLPGTLCPGVVAPDRYLSKG